MDACIYYLDNGLGMHQHFAKGYDLVFKQLKLLALSDYNVYLWNTWMGETEGIISLVDHQVLVSSYVFVIAGERITQRSKNVVLKIWQCVKNKGKQRELSDHWKSINDSKRLKDWLEYKL